MIPGWKRTPPTAPKYVRNIQTGKSKKESLCPGKFEAGEKNLAYRPPTDIKNIEKGNEEKKSWYQYVFLDGGFPHRPDH
jgi:hypothetical protein